MKILKMMARSLANIARASKVNESSLRRDSGYYDYYVAIPEDRRVKVIMSQGYSEEQVTRLLKRLSTARQRADAEYRDRTHLCRKEARAVHLARMYLKGTPYKMVEEKTYSRPNWDRVEELISMHTIPLIPPQEETKTPNENNVAYQSFENWRKGN